MDTASLSIMNKATDLLARACVYVSAARQGELTASQKASAVPRSFCLTPAVAGLSDFTKRFIQPDTHAARRAILGVYNTSATQDEMLGRTSFDWVDVLPRASADIHAPNVDAKTHRYKQGRLTFSITSVTSVIGAEPASESKTQPLWWCKCTVRQVVTTSKLGKKMDKQLLLTPAYVAALPQLLATVTSWPVHMVKHFQLNHTSYVAIRYLEFGVLTQYVHIYTLVDYVSNRIALIAPR